MTASQILERGYVANFDLTPAFSKVCELVDVFAFLTYFRRSKHQRFPYKLIINSKFLNSRKPIKKQ